MPKEATIICVDNSEWMRDGDYAPTRYEAQKDAINLLCGTKTEDEESRIGAVSMGEKVEVLVTLTKEPAKIMSALPKLDMIGAIQFVKAVSVAQLALKHRENKQLGPRIIAFVGSPLQETDAELVKLGKKLKKNNISVDVINFGEMGENTAKLEAFISAVNNKENTSHLITIPPGPHIISEILLSSPIIMSGNAAEAEGAASFEFGVDPTLDPELALALRVSMEEERQRQASEARRAAATTESGSGSEAAPAQTTAAQQALDDNDAMAVEENALLQQALAMSLSGAEADSLQEQRDRNENFSAFDDLSEEEQIARALQMSMNDGGNSEFQNNQQSTLGQMMDPAFLNSVLGSLPGVDPNDPNIQNALSSLVTPRETDKQPKDSSDKKDNEKMDEDKESDDSQMQE